ncbi:hypothetical protein Tsubulata_033926 [Turnera subulata]|uniref:Cytosolic endo-beta-N-acetylglucosaminidase TIM barrel domain-containing protein n=1 Tax=Turnera subulata TaxID=218843 RepID=A0A9Q0JQX6_9ROSI|nr:hypothetical protein Tsubulata_033926 [Turnera subulata]
MTQRDAVDAATTPLLCSYRGRRCRRRHRFRQNPSLRYPLVEILRRYSSPLKPHQAGGELSKAGLRNPVRFEVRAETKSTEGDVGGTICNKLLSTKESADMYADLLVELAVALGFDGWLIQLNDNNKLFFDNCDGIFVNYTWEENYSKLSAAVAGDRKDDVYTGIDVFGRGTYGGGGWDTSVALDVVKKGNVSAAIFAPGWVYETKQPPDFYDAQNR